MSHCRQANFPFLRPLRPAGCVSVPQPVHTGPRWYTPHNKDATTHHRLFHPPTVAARSPCAAPATPPTPPLALRQKTALHSLYPRAFPAWSRWNPGIFLRSVSESLHRLARCHSCCSAPEIHPALQKTRLPLLLKIEIKKNRKADW